MWWLIVEALAALGLLLFMVWWTMFSGRRRGHDERGYRDDREDDSDQANLDDRRDRRG